MLKPYSHHGFHDLTHAKRMAHMVFKPFLAALSFVNIYFLVTKFAAINAVTGTHARIAILPIKAEETSVAT